jgi:hypothetical protein
MEPSNYDDILRYCNLSEVQDYWQNKVDGMHNRSENGSDAKFVLRTHFTHTQPLVYGSRGFKLL